MKKFISIIILVLAVTAAVFAEGNGKVTIDDNGNVTTVDVRKNCYEAAIHFGANNRPYYASEIKIGDSWYTYITDGIEAYMIPQTKYRQVYWKYQVDVRMISGILAMDSNYKEYIAINSMKATNDDIKLERIEFDDLLTIAIMR